MLRTIFLGSPDIAVPFLERQHSLTQIQTVISNPDQPAGRGYELKATPVKKEAHKLELSVWQPETLKDPAQLAMFQSFKADLGIVVAYGKLLPQNILQTAKHGFLNVHFSLLPKYRGAAPIQWALANGETETGVTLFWLDQGMDTGPIFIQKKLAIGPGDNAEAMRNKLVELGVAALAEAITLIENGSLLRAEQTGEATKAPILKKEDGRIDWSRPAEVTLNRLRGFYPWPGCYTEGLKVVQARVEPDGSQAKPGTVIRLVSPEGPVVKCGRNALLLLEVQPDGKKAMNAWSWWQGARLKVGEPLR